ncbi:MAG: DUF3501 family protein [Minwuia sp.]|uniref:DUF3501 family protein n=1 Tax=Minwuia sp. TaxID=2493630 RepID=UPI003A86D9D3
MTIAMKTELTAADIVDNATFDAQRKEKQAELRTHKTHRRVDVGPFASFFFESWFTMWWQIQEMLRVEGGGEEQLADELEAYASLVPNGRNLTATMMLQIADPVRRARELSKLGGIEHAVVLVIGGEEVRGEAEDDLDRTTADGKASSVHFFLFPLSDKQIAALKDGSAEVQLRITHDNYNHIAILSDEQKKALAADLA